MKRSPSSLSPGDFYNREVLPALFERLDSAFSEFGWVRDSRGGWKATKRVSCVDARPDRVVCHAPFGFLVHGEGSTTWASYVNGGTSPRGPNFVEVVRKLAELAGVNPSPLDRELSTDERAAWEKRERRGVALEQFLAITQNALLGDEGKAARDYLVGRGFQEDELGSLELGVYTNPKEVQRLLNIAGVDEDEARSAELLDARWTCRLVGAMRNRLGTLETFFARDLTEKTEPKYLYLARGEKPDFFGLSVAARTKEGRENLIIVEGVLDVPLLHSRGLLNVVAIGGGSASTEKLERLYEAGIRKVTLALDYDLKADGKFPGLDGTRTTAANAHKGEKVPVVLVLHPKRLQEAAGTPEGEKVDPGSLVCEKGVEAFRGALEMAEPSGVFLAKAALENITPESIDKDRYEAATLAVDLVETFRGNNAPLDREDALKLVAERTGYSFGALSEMTETRLERRAKEDRARELRGIGGEVDRGLREGRDAAELARDIGRRLAQITTSTMDVPPPFSVDRLYQEMKDMPAGRKSGWTAIDALDVEFCPGDLTVIGARTGHCKTTFLVGLLMNWLRKAADENSDETFVFYSSEEPEIRILHRLLALAIPTTESHGWTVNEIKDYLRAGLDSRNGHQWPSPTTIDEARTTLYKLESRLFVVYRPQWDVDTIAKHARGLAERKKIGGIFIDYLQRIQAPPSVTYERRDIAVSAVARGMKSLAVEIGVPVITGAQINREAAKEVDRAGIDGKSYAEAKKEIKNGRPQLHHLREGGSEQEADTILGLLNYRADFTHDDTGEKKIVVPATTLVEIGTLKGRYSEAGRWAKLAFDGRYHRLRDPVKYANETKEEP